MQISPPDFARLHNYIITTYMHESCEIISIVAGTWKLDVQEIDV